MNIKTAKFVVSNQNVKDCPKENIPEYAFIGRSNVGKSSLINMLANNKKLAKTSSKPGKTRLINHFKIDSSWFLVDLPGYGYAKASKTEKKQFQKLITDYFIYRKQLINAFILVDVRHEAQKIDIEFMRWLTTNDISFSIIFTKIDKLKQSGNPNEGVEFKVEEYKKVLLENWEFLPKIFLTSSVKHIGKENIMGYINTLNQSISQNKF
ncbi:MAG: YihA family ribosome biogenesis GTP-binding protein [Flavobacteriaceae bacterium]|nr:YihA family ribosome biogenesis GTP-binding protein [Flavobacteriaceae bacterium]|tara:strand:- start:26895 stop:27521 length:627 start_codon:yes stop_codon:yes gene_type:complete